eukprot:326106_1
MLSRADMCLGALRSYSDVHRPTISKDQPLETIHSISVTHRNCGTHADFGARQASGLVLFGHIFHSRIFDLNWGYSDDGEYFEDILDNSLEKHPEVVAFCRKLLSRVGSRLGALVAVREACDGVLLPRPVATLSGHRADGLLPVHHSGDGMHQSRHDNARKFDERRPNVHHGGVQVDAA